MTPRSLGWCRAAVGAIFLLRTTPLLVPLGLPFVSDATPLLGWPRDGWRVAAFGVVLPSALIAILCVARTIAAALFMLGVRARAAGIVAGACGYVVLARDALAFVNSLHLLYLATIVLAVAGSTASGVRLVRAFVVSIYVWSGVAKLNASWLGGEALALMHDDGFLRGAIGDAIVASDARRIAVAWGVAIFELAIGPALLWRRSRAPALVAAFAFHAVIEDAMRPDVIGWAMAALLLSFVERQGQPPSQRAASAGQTTSP